MMKKYIILSIIALGMCLTSCDDYLDKLPDDRAEMDSQDKVTQLLVSAYLSHSPNFLFLMSSDDVDDNGKVYSAQQNQEQMYRWQTIEGRNNDDPRSLWQDYYEKAATANLALATIEQMGNPESLRGQRAEALLCRAYAMFMCANTFCMAYDPTKAEEYMGIPYPKEPDVSVKDRGTLKETYENIAADIEDAMKDLSEEHLRKPKYHWNKKAANAFAARFYLYYHDYDKVIKYASAALGANPTDNLRDIASLSSLGATDFFHAYKNSTVNANFIMMPMYSICGRTASGSSSYLRFCHNSTMANYETFWPRMPWGSGSSANTLWASHKLYGSNQAVRFPIQQEEFEYTDKLGNSGYAHIIDVPFQAEETLLCRAEAYALKGDQEKAVEDMNYWMSSFCASSYTYTSGGKSYRITRPTLTQQLIDEFYNDTTKHYAPVIPNQEEMDQTRSIIKRLHPQGFTVEEGSSKEHNIQMILQMRRITMLYHGIRFQDLKRYGIEYCHFLDGEDPIVFKAGDLRGAIQIPDDVINDGVKPNPREN